MSNTHSNHHIRLRMETAGMVIRCECLYLLDLCVRARVLVCMVKSGASVTIRVRQQIQIFY